jgi:hypothetical protein
MAAAAGSLGVPLGTIRAAKEAGADGFLSAGRVDTKKLLAWLLTRGEQFTPALSLEEARAKLTLARTEALQREAGLAGGQLIGRGSACKIVEDQFGQGTGWIDGRVQELAVLLSTVQGDPDQQARLKEVTHLLADDAQRLRTGLRHVRDGILHDLKST